MIAARHGPPYGRDVKLEEVSVHLERRRRATLIVRVSLGLAALTAVAMDVAHALGPSRNGLSVHLIRACVACLAVAVLTLAGRFRGFRDSESSAKLVVDDEAIAFDTHRSSGDVPLTEIEEVLIWRSGHLELRRVNGDVLHILAPGKIAALIAAVEAGDQRRAVRVTLGDTEFPTWIGALLGFPVALAMTAFSARFATATLNVGVFAASWYGVFLAFRAMLGPDSLLVGADGVTVQKAFSTRFIPLDDLVRVETQPDHVRLHLKDDRVLTASARHLAEDQSTLIARRVDLAVKGRLSKSPLLEPAELDRRGRPIAAWRRELAGLLTADKDYRRAPVTAEDLARILAAPEVGAERRLGAAIALAVANGPGMRQRVRLTAYSIANEPMRFALKHVADGWGNDAVIEKALAAARATA